MWMKKRSQQIFEEPEMLVIEGETYERQDLQFDQLTDENGVVRFHISGQQPVPDCRYMLYDKVAQGVLWLENATMEAQWLSFTYQEIVKPVYEDGINLYTLLAVNKKEKCAYTFCYTKETKANAYDRMGNILHKDDLGKAWDGQNMDAVLYIAEKNKMLRLLVQKEYLFLKAFLDAKVETVNMKKDTVILHVSLQDYGYRITRIYMQLRSKTEERTYDFGIRTRKERGAYHLTAQIHLKDLQMAQFYWDIKADTEKDGIVRAIELKNHEKWMHRIMYLQQMHYVYADGNIVYPYKTKSRNIALHFRQKTEQDCWAFIMKEYLALAIYYISRPWLKRRNIWLVYEKYCVMAQDNSFYFFKYCMEQLPESERKRIYYVIDKKASDYQYVRQYGDRVIDFLSLKHMIYLKAASLLISSDTKAHAYAWHSTNSVYRNMLKWKENVFLQHGVIAFKCCHQGLRKKSVNASSLFVVSSDVEKQIILDYFGYNEDQILVTGLARWDVLEDKSKGEPRQIILMPTWRTWLEEVSEAVFKASDYYKNYMALLNNRTLIDTLEEYQVTLNFYIHPKFREYMGTFQVESDYVKLIPFGSEPLNEMMMRCSMMITDYSSAVWDVFYQGKPVLFYLFDLEMYNEVQGSYIDMETETFGDVAHTPETLVELIREYAQNDFKEKEVYGRKRDKEIAYIDNKNSERIYREIAKRYATSLSTPEDALP